jgi:hypothetical protein
MHLIKDVYNSNTKSKVRKNYSSIVTITSCINILKLSVEFHCRQASMVV